MGKGREFSFSKRGRPSGNKLALMSNRKLKVGSREIDRQQMKNRKPGFIASSTSYV